jgi:hypothetical protein
MSRQRSSSFYWRPGSLARRWWSEFRRPRGDLPWFKRVRRRLLLWLPIAVPAILILGGLSAYVGIGLRARYLAAEGMRSVANDVFARGYRQIMVAQSLRPGDPAVHRAWVYVRSRTNDEPMLAEWEALAAEDELTPLEAKEHARLALVFGTEAQFDAAITALEAKGEAGHVAGLRAQLAARRGDYSRAVALGRTAVAAGDDDELRLELLRFLLMRYGPALMPPAVPSEEDDQAMAEIVQLTEALRGTKYGPRAVSMALPAAPIPRTIAWQWAQDALQDRSAGNLALLLAADYSVESGAAEAATLAAEFRPVFQDAPLDRRAEFASWLNRNGQSALVPEVLNADDAVSGTSAYAARAEALSNLAQWPALYEMSGMESSVVPLSLRLSTRAVAARRLGEDSLVPDLVAQSLDNASREQRLPETVRAFDFHGESVLVDDILLALCARRDAAPEAYPLARARFKGRGDEEAVLRALDAAGQVVPDHLAVQDSRRRRDLLAGRPVDPAETAAAIAVAPADIPLRLTHALALVKADRSDEALAVFDQVDVFLTELSPAEQAIVYAVLRRANGQSFNAARLLAAIDRTRLTDEEDALITEDL